MKKTILLILSVVVSGFAQGRTLNWPRDTIKMYRAIVKELTPGSVVGVGAGGILKDTTITVVDSSRAAYKADTAFKSGLSTFADSARAAYKADTAYKSGWSKFADSSRACHVADTVLHEATIGGGVITGLSYGIIPSATSETTLGNGKITDTGVSTIEIKNALTGEHDSAVIALSVTSTDGTTNPRAQIVAKKSFWGTNIGELKFKLLYNDTFLTSMILNGNGGMLLGNTPFTTNLHDCGLQIRHSYAHPLRFVSAIEEKYFDFYYASGYLSFQHYSSGAGFLIDTTKIFTVNDSLYTTTGASVGNCTVRNSLNVSATATADSVASKAQTITAKGLASIPFRINRYGTTSPILNVVSVGLGNGSLNLYNSSDEQKVHLSSSGSSHFLGGMVGVGCYPSSTFHDSGSIAFPVGSIKTTTYTATDKDYSIYCEPAADDTLNLPQCSACPGRIYIVTNYQYNTVYIDPYSTETISGEVGGYCGGDPEDGNARNFMIQSDGVSNWRILMRAY